MSAYQFHDATREVENDQTANVISEGSIYLVFQLAREGDKEGILAVHFLRATYQARLQEHVPDH